MIASTWVVGCVAEIPDGGEETVDESDAEIEQVDQELLGSRNLAYAPALNAIRDLLYAPALQSGCADGTAEQTFGRGIVGCAGSVTWENRASLCAAGYHPVSALGWHSALNGTVPQHHYWTNDDLRYSGSGSNNCAASHARGTPCPSNQPMRVCATSTVDPEGNACNWVGCSLEGAADGVADYFGGCVGNATAGTLCVRNSGCADGSVEQTFSRGMVGCAGAVSFANAASLCSAGYMLVRPGEWTRLRNGVAPTHNYWTEYGPKYRTGSAASCNASSHAGETCPADSPMRVCVPGGADPEGNQCEWSSCTYDNSGSNDYLGGCFNNPTAGALCMPEGCADGTTEQTWNKFVHGCAGTASFADRASQCTGRGMVVTASTWLAFRGNLPPTHNYWTYDALRWSGSGSGYCAASPTSGYDCGGGGQMLICTSSGSDAEGNSCIWTGCGLDNSSVNNDLGGCGYSGGVICMTGP